MKKHLQLINLVGLWLISITGWAQSEGFIYGTVTSWDGKTYTGQIRWGKEEAFWTDMFNASKTENNYVDQLSREDFARLRESRNESNQWWDQVRIKYVSDGNYIHQFGCQFGNIKSLKMRNSNRVELELRDGRKLNLGGSGYNDIGTDIRVYVPELGKVELDWNDVDMVSFQPTPARFESAIGQPLYGKVEAWNGTYTGLIQWDKDERVTVDVLDGEDQDREMEIAFKNIASLKKRGRGTMVTLKNGESYFLEGSNDVGKGHRGVVVTNNTYGRVVIDWEDFESLTFTEVPKLNSYGSFAGPKSLMGQITTVDGKQISGRIIYDLDEAYGFELLDGSKDETKFEIPFALIKEIKPRNSGRSQVVLRDGTELMLADGQDVSNRHSGLLVFKSDNDDKPTYITWEQVEMIAFQ